MYVRVRARVPFNLLHPRLIRTSDLLGEWPNHISAPPSIFLCTAAPYPHVPVSMIATLLEIRGQRSEVGVLSVHKRFVVSVCGNSCL